MSQREPEWVLFYIELISQAGISCNVYLGGRLQKRGWTHIFSMPQHYFVAKRLNTTLFCRETLKYGTFCCKTLKYSLWPKKWHKLILSWSGSDPPFLASARHCKPSLRQVMKKLSWKDFVSQIFVFFPEKYERMQKEVISGAEYRWDHQGWWVDSTGVCRLRRFCKDWILWLFSSPLTFYHLQQI